MNSAITTSKGNRTGGPPLKKPTRAYRDVRIPIAVPESRANPFRTNVDIKALTSPKRTAEKCQGLTKSRRYERYVRALGRMREPADCKNESRRDGWNLPEYLEIFRDLRIPDPLLEFRTMSRHFSVVPTGLFKDARKPRTASWAMFSRPYGTRFC
jgi:hypothetical protein